MESPIRNFYTGKNILVTGVTGFLGKAVVEKLLRSCPELGTVYIILRPKGGNSVKERTAALFANAIFDSLKSQYPSQLEKVVPISGDMSLPSLGLSPEARITLTSNLNIILHCAATVKFEEALGSALRTNVLGTRRLLQLARDCPFLLSFLHVSTAFSNFELGVIEERVYPLPLPEPLASSLLLKLEGDEGEDLRDLDLPVLLGSKPNTYIFSKAWAEWLVQEEGRDLPVAIVRPSIVSASLREPVPGWVDNLLGPSAPVAAISAGLLHSALIHGEKRVDLVPVDILVNLLLSVAWDLAERNCQQKLPVYNCCTSPGSPVSYADVTNHLVKGMKKFPLLTENPGRIWIILWKSEWAHFLLDLLVHRIPGQVLDLLAVLTGQKPKYMKNYYKMAVGMAVLRPFHTNEWKYETGNMDSLRGRMGTGDREDFNFETRGIDWESFLLSYYLGLCKFVFGKVLAKA